MKLKSYIIAVTLFLCVLAGSFFFGYRLYPKLNPCPEIASDTILVHDTVTHHITDTVPFYIVKRDSVIQRIDVPAIVDTSAILADYFALHYFTRIWEDSLLLATSEDVVSENQFIDNVFTYQIKRPQSIINNSVDNSIYYSSYFNIGISLPLTKMEYAEIEAFYAFRRGHVGFGYIPSLKSPSFKIGLNLFKFK
jgi:hypothetical protein